ncbi:MAG: 1-(5-phosphoribosyl)-5-[Lachnospiraceae bacterium]|nr:1-(5-phosphoribosyl)-5-[(5-phosphoribosylamino)methylideneamino]imidazole-4-carboxamide isomerase [Lachnospiraceae bacterium]
MNIFPAIDLYDGCAVRLVKGDYQQMQIYSNDPVSVAKQFEAAGAEYLHVVDLAGAKDGTTPNLETIRAITANTSLKVEVGGGIRSEEVIRTYLNAGVFRVILGTVAVTEPEFAKAMVAKYGEQIAVGVDIRDGFVAIKGWTETSALSCREFCKGLSEIGVKTIICTDISKDGCLSGTNLPLYRQLSEEFSMNIVASGGVSSLDDVRALKAMNLYGAILGKALYTGNIDLAEAVKLCGAQN